MAKAEKTSTFEYELKAGDIVKIDGFAFEFKGKTDPKKKLVIKGDYLGEEFCETKD